MDLMWLLILFGLFMLSILTVFISSVLNALVRQLHPLVYVVIVAALSYVFSNFFYDQHTVWPVVFVVAISYVAPLLVVTLYNKGVRVERERQT